MTVELLLIACIQYSSICCDKIADVGGLYLMVNQIKEEAQRENYNKVRCCCVDFYNCKLLQLNIYIYIYLMEFSTD